MREEHNVLALFRSEQTRSLLLCCHKTYLLFILFLCPVYFSTPIKSLFLYPSQKYLGLQPFWVSGVMSASLFCKKYYQPRLFTANIESKHHQVIHFFNCSIFLKRGAKATRIINREAFLPNKISLSILRKNEMKTENCQLSDSAGCSNNFFVNICPVIAFQMMEICDWLSFSSHC